MSAWCAADPGASVPLAPLGSGSAEQREGRCTASGTREEIALRGRVVICPSGGRWTGVSSPLCKNILVFTPPKSLLELFVSHPKRGACHDRHERGVGCGGRGSVLRATGSQGGFSGIRERSTAR